MVAPVFLFAYANDRGHDARYLRNLPEERRAIEKALRAAEDAGQLKLRERPNATIEEVLEECQRASDRLAVFHFAGHADGTSLMFERADGTVTSAGASSIADFLGGLGGLKLVVLNGCSTAAQVDMLLARGIAAVVATSCRVRDDVATTFASYLYTAIGKGETIATAFHHAASAVVVTHTAGWPAAGVRVLDPLCRDVEGDGPPVSSHSLWTLHGSEAATQHRLVEKSGAQRPASAASTLGIADLLRTCQAAMPGHLRAMARQKYVQALYVPRAATAALADVGVSEERFRSDVRATLVRLTHIAQAYPLPDAELAIERASIELMNGLVFEELERAVHQLMDAFHVRTIERALAEVEVAMRVGGPELDAAESRIRAVLQSFPLCTSLDAFMDCVDDAARIYYASGAARPNAVLALFPGDGTGTAPILVTEILAALRAECARFCRRATALVGPAGMGKTNALWALAETLGQRVPVLFIEGHRDLTHEATLEQGVQHAVERAAGGPVHDWREALRTVLDEPTRWLVLCVDGIDENADLARAAQALAQFLGRCEDLRIHVVLSCRDIAWEAFHDRLRPLLVGDRPIRLDAFTDGEWAAASHLYLERFGIRCVLGPDAQAVLRHPLLLRLFCETYEGSDLGSVADLRPLDVFQSYFDGAARRVAERTGSLRPASAIALLERVATATWRARGPVSPDAVGLTLGDLDQHDSLYNRLRSEGILAEHRSLAGPEQGNADAFLAGASSRWALPDVSIHFVYSPMAEFLIAGQWTRVLGAAPTAAALDGVLASAADALTSFPAAVGVIVFLDRLRDAGGSLVGRFLHLLVERGDEVVTQLQPMVTYAFDHVAVQDIDSSVIRALVRLEVVARPEIREALAPGMLRLIAARRTDPELHGLAARILGVPLEEIVHPPRSEDASSRVAALPPPRYRYKYETRLSALRILAGQCSEPAVEMVVRGIRQLGQQDLHAALIAFRALDAAPELIVFQVIESYLAVHTPEYRIFAAWLLRNRDGATAAAFLVRLLTDPDHRVHYYTSHLLRKRSWSSPLVAGACHVLREVPLRAWHVLNLLAGLRQIDRVQSPGLAAVDPESVRQAAMRWARSSNRAVRIAAYRTLAACGAGNEVSDLLEEEADRIVLALAGATRSAPATDSRA